MSKSFRVFFLCFRFLREVLVRLSISVILLNEIAEMEGENRRFYFAGDDKRLYGL